LEHYFADNCYVLDRIVPTYFIFSGLWGFIAIAFTGILYLMPLNSRLNLQKSIILFPALKVLELLL